MLHLICISRRKQRKLLLHHFWKLLLYYILIINFISDINWLWSSINVVIVYSGKNHLNLNMWLHRNLVCTIWVLKFKDCLILYYSNFFNYLKFSVGYRVFFVSINRPGKSSLKCADVEGCATSGVGFQKNLVKKYILRLSWELFQLGGIQWRTTQ